MKKPRYPAGHREPEGPVVMYEKAIPNKAAPEYWVVMLQWPDPSKKGGRAYDRAANWPEARKLAKKVRANLEATAQLVTGENPRFDLAWAEYFAYCETRDDIGPGYLANICRAGELFVEEFADKPVRNITSLDIEAWYRKLKTKPWQRKGRNGVGYSDSSRNGHLSMWSGFFRYAKRKAWVEYSPLRMDPFKRTEPKKRFKVPTWDEIERQGESVRAPRTDLDGFGIASKMPMFAWAKRRIIFALGAYGGLRPEEIAALRWERVNLPRAFFEVDAEEGAVAYKIGVTSPKTPAGARIIPMSQYLYDELAWYGDFLTGKGRPPKRGFILFPSMSHARYRKIEPQDVEENVYFTRINKLHVNGMKQAGMIGADGLANYTQHALRHFYVSASVLLGVNIEVVAKRVGHQSGAYTSKTYAHVLKTDEEGFIDEVPNEAIWRERFKRATPPAQLVRIDDRTGEVIPVEPDRTALVDMRYTRTGAIQLPAQFQANGWSAGAIPQSSKRGWLQLPDWLAEAIALLNAGMSPPEMAQRIRKDPSSICAVFRQAGLPTPQRCAIMVREARFRELANLEYGAKDTARVMDCSVDVVQRWRQREGLAEPAKSPNNKAKSVLAAKRVASLLRQDEPKLL